MVLGPLLGAVVGSYGVLLFGGSIGASPHAEPEVVPLLGAGADAAGAVDGGPLAAEGVAVEGGVEGGAAGHAGGEEGLGDGVEAVRGGYG